MNILVVRHDKIGDFVTALPACFIIKQHFPHCQLSVFIAPINHSIAKLCPFIDHIIIDDGKNSLKLAQQLQKHHFDLSFTLFSNTRIALAQYLARIPKRVAPATKLAQIFYNQRVLQRRSQVKMAEFEYNIQLVQHLFPQINTIYPQPLLHMTKNTSFNKKDQKTIAFHPGSGGSSDANWTVQEYIELAQSISHHPHLHIIFTFGPGDEVFLQHFTQLKGKLAATTYVSTTSLADFTAIIASFSLFISTSTGTFHLASAVGTPTMTFFADSLFASAKRWKSIGKEALQHHYMIPHAKDKRKAMFKKVKEDLSKLI